MPFDANDPDQAKAVSDAVAAAEAKIKADTAKSLAELAATRDSFKTAAETAAAERDAARTELEAAKASGTATAAELATLKAAADEAAKAADKAIVESLPEAARALVAGKTGADLKAAADVILGIANKAVPGRAAGDGPIDAPTNEDIEWAKAKGYADASPNVIVLASKKHGPRAAAEKSRKTA